MAVSTTTPLWRYIRLSLADILLATSLAECEPKDRSSLWVHTAFLLTHFGDLNGAMKLYEQALQIDEGLGDLKGKSATLANMGVVLYQRGKHKASLQSFLEALITLEKMGAIPDARTVAGWVARLRKELGGETFDPLWSEITNNSPLPEWLTLQPEEEQGTTPEQFITAAIQAHLQRQPEAQKYYEACVKMAKDENVPAELRALGHTLQRILIGDQHPDLSSLPKEWSDLITTLLADS